MDPRLSGRYQLSEDTNVRLAWGIYHQFPAPFEYNPTSGNPGLGPQRAQHWIGGLHHERGRFLLRLDGLQSAALAPVAGAPSRV